MSDVEKKSNEESNPHLVENWTAMLCLMEMEEDKFKAPILKHKDNATQKSP